MTNPEILMCAPLHYAVAYVINPWMEGRIGTTESVLAQSQWDALVGHLHRLNAKIHFLDPQEKVPDLVFTANAGLVYGNECILSHFKYPERQGEEIYNKNWFEAHGFKVRTLPDDVYFEGAGDALFWLDKDDKPLKKLFAAAGYRSDTTVFPILEEWLNVDLVKLQLANPHYYHLDTCFCPLPGERLIWHPPAFDEKSQELIRQHVPAGQRYEVIAGTAWDFACNAVGIHQNIVMNNADADLENWLRNQGFNVIQTSLSEFIKAGGAAKCLTLRVR